MKTCFVLFLFVVSGFAAPTEDFEDWQRTKKSPSYGPSCGGGQLAPISLYMAAGGPQPQYRESEIDEHSARSYYESGLSFGEGSGVGGYGSGGAGISGLSGSGAAASSGGYSGASGSSGIAGGYTGAGANSGLVGGLASGGYGSGANSFSSAGGAGYSSAGLHSGAAASSGGYSGSGASSGHSSGANSISFGGYGGGTSSLSGAISTGPVHGPAIGLFPNARVGGCNVPLLLSCAPNVIAGHIAESHVYSAPAYRHVEDHMMREAEATKMRESSHKPSEEVSEHHDNSDTVAVQKQNEKSETQ